MNAEEEEPKRVEVEPGEIVLRAESIEPPEVVEYTSPPSSYSAREVVFLIIAVGLIGVTLAAIIIPKFSFQKSRPPLVIAKTDIALLETALDAFEIDNSRYPTASEGLAALLASPASTVGSWHGPYITSLPADPWGRPYLYTYPGTHQGEVDLSSAGPDGKFGTADDIHNW